MQFQIRMSGDSEEKVKQAKVIAAQQGISFLGDGKKGKFSGRIMGGRLVGTYLVENGILIVNVVEKPILVSWNMVEGQLVEFLKS